jgi:leader peptidase (prepilin peptidase)/N-methyltransferase
VNATIVSELRPLWLVAGSGLLTLVWVDALTTWLPTQLMRLVTGELIVAVLISAILSATPTTLLSQVLMGAAGNGAVFILVWWVTKGLGFGDVRLAPLIGAVAGSLGINGWYTALLAGSLVGVVWGLFARRNPAPGTSGGFAYGPALWCGPYLAYLSCQLIQASS